METIIKTDLKEKLKGIIVMELAVQIPIEEITDDVSLYEDGLGLDSISIVNLIVLIEKHFGLTFEENEISAAFFNNINSLAGFIQSKLSK